MWLLSTNRAELYFFVSPEVVKDGYAILSHVWGEQETSFQEHRALIRRCHALGLNPRTYASLKIRRCCELAEQHGYKWIWNDTCCIDKSSSSELSEAVNSMFRYYSMSRVCYAYLQDVPSNEGPSHTEQSHEWDLQFSQSRWHTRGWTLQELIAPREMILLSGNWDVLGTKLDLADKLEEATRVPASLLTLDRSVDDFSVAQRLSWAASRRTTRREDEAYSLLGLFDITMPTLYGEGQNAFFRLQEEIMKKTSDTTLFAWGAFHEGWSWHGNYPARFLFAPSVEAFKACARFVFTNHTLANLHEVRGC